MSKAALVLAFIGALLSGAAQACSCTPPQVGTRFENARDIVRGRAVSVRLGDREALHDGSAYRPLVFTFEVSETVKGTVAGAIDVQALPQFCGSGGEAMLSAVMDSDIEVELHSVEGRSGQYTTSPCGHFLIRGRTGHFQPMRGRD